MIFCPNCNKLTGYKRALGFGTFFAVVVTAGFWLLAIPLYPKRCIACGLDKSASVPWYHMGRASVLALLVLGIFIAALFYTNKDESNQLAPIIKGPDYNEVSTSKVPPEARKENATAAGQQQASANAVSTAVATDQEIRWQQSPFSTNIVSDGRTYSVAMVVRTPNIPLGVTLFSQGKILRFGYASMESRKFAVIGDEYETDKTLLCAMMEDEGTEAFSLYHAGEVVQASGEYMGNLPLAGNPSMPIFSHCQVADGRTKVVRAATSPLNYVAHESDHLLVHMTLLSRAQSNDSFSFQGSLVGPIPKTLFWLTERMEIRGTGTSADGHNNFVLAEFITEKMHYVLLGDQAPNALNETTPASEITAGTELDIRFTSTSLYEETSISAETRR